MATIYVIRSVGSTLILPASSGPGPILPTVLIVAQFRSGDVTGEAR